MKKQDWKGKELDKDLLIQGNKIYSPESCMFIPKKINSLLVSSKSRRGKYKLVVSKGKSSSRYKARCHNGLKDSITIGHFKSEDEAHEAYKRFKYKIINDIAVSQAEPLKSALLNYVISEY